MRCSCGQSTLCTWREDSEARRHKGAPPQALAQPTTLVQHPQTPSQPSPRKPPCISLTRCHTSAKRKKDARLDDDRPNSDVQTRTKPAYTGPPWASYITTFAITCAPSTVPRALDAVHRYRPTLDAEPGLTRHGHATRSFFALAIRHPTSAGIREIGDGMHPPHRTDAQMSLASSCSCSSSMQHPSSRRRLLYARGGASIEKRYPTKAPAPLQAVVVHISFANTRSPLRAHIEFKKPTGHRLAKHKPTRQRGKGGRNLGRRGSTPFRCLTRVKRKGLQARYDRLLRRTTRPVVEMAFAQLSHTHTHVPADWNLFFSHLLRISTLQMAKFT